jgi:hypothetical protein
MHIISMTFLLLLLLPLPGWSTALNLFVIQRSKNAIAQKSPCARRR